MYGTGHQAEPDKAQLPVRIRALVSAASGNVSGIARIRLCGSSRCRWARDTAPGRWAPARLRAVRPAGRGARVLLTSILVHALKHGWRILPQRLLW